MTKVIREKVGLLFEKLEDQFWEKLAVLRERYPLGGLFNDNPIAHFLVEELQILRQERIRFMNRYNYIKSFLVAEIKALHIVFLKQ